MIVILKVPKSVINELNENKIVYPITPKIKRYQILRDSSNMENFFFSMKYSEKNTDHLYELCGMSSDGNTERLKLRVPDDIVLLTIISLGNQTIEHHGQIKK